ncbi:hypothetical protein QWY99_22035 [Flavobacterium branchiarum]|uniref:Uncharacterized protein n=1 Tax=Flavobacterium branchiarum TaxID=1114870 RepID=A0ABV5FJ44_9FLAO|nr:hypothetical protein [Flavobacterium branchiarum]MDN3672639.1 hypothetical protein [Flavobacterium branchiarum]MDN3675717.1 hypothetical protein [Flavobacterium branchiarum]
MYINKKRRKPDAKKESIFDTEARLVEEARKIAKNFQHVKPVKYLLK